MVFKLNNKDKKTFEELKSHFPPIYNEKWEFIPRSHGAKIRNGFLKYPFEVTSLRLVTHGFLPISPWWICLKKMASQLFKERIKIVLSNSLGSIP